MLKLSLLQKEMSVLSELSRSFAALSELSFGMYGDDRVAKITFIFYISRVLTRIYLETPSGVDAHTPTSTTRIIFDVLNFELVRDDEFQRVLRDMLPAQVDYDYQALFRRLATIGLSDLWPRAEEPFAIMRSIAYELTGAASAVLLIETAALALEYEDIERASEYLYLSRRLDLHSWELYRVFILDGLIALRIGNVDHAIQCLRNSTAACQRDEYSSVECGVRPPDLRLAQQLLKYGESAEVLCHLIESQNVWQRLTPQWKQWIQIIESGQTPAFEQCAWTLSTESPSITLKMQWLRACSLEENPHLNVPRSKSPDEVISARERLREKFVNSKWNKQISES